MSADLFAEFGSFSSGSSQPKQNAALQAPNKPSILPTSDPFAFLSSPTAQTASPQAFHAPSQPWPSKIQTQQGGSNGWSNFGTTGATTSGIQPSAQETQDDEDGWGDFEEAPPSTTAAKPPPSILNNNLPITKTGPMANQEPPFKPRIYRADTLDLMSNNLVQIDGAKKTEPWQDRPSWEKTKPVTKKPSKLSLKSGPQLPFTKPKPKSNNSDVLFDADEFDGEPPEDEDDFGDFETGEVKTPTAKDSAPAQSSIDDLLSIDFGSPAPPSTTEPMSSSLFVPAPAPVPAPLQLRKEPPSQLLSTLNVSALSPSPDSLYPQPPKSPSFSDRNPFPGLAVTTPVSGTFPQELKDDDKEKSPTPITAWPEAQSAKDKDDWDAFADFPPDASSAATPGGPAAFSSNWDWDAVDSPQPAAQRPTSKSSQRKASTHEETIGPPPTNVPPPSILLSIFPELLEEADTKLYQPTAKQSPAVKSRIYAKPETLDYLRGYLNLTTVAARILAGRKLRWHRDKFLSQGMTISAAGSKGGMKLAGIDKTQAAREDREAADVVGVWRDHIGKLRSAVAAANIGIQKQPVKMKAFRVPDINDHMAVSTAKVVPTAPRPCVVCGLKRDERVKGVDMDVEDSFGEWWIEHWGHRACRSFWLGNEVKLRSR